MATTAEGLVVPSGSDAFDPQGDIVALATSVQSRMVIPVANSAARSALVSAISWTPSSTQPLIVWRADATSGRELEVTTNGSSWRVLNNADTGWLIPTLANSWSSLNSNRQVRYRLQNGVVRLKGVAAGGSTTTIFTLPTGFRPLQDWRVLQQSGDSGTTAVSVVISPAGVVAAATGTQPCLDNIVFPADG